MTFDYWLDPDSHPWPLVPWVQVNPNFCHICEYEALKALYCDPELYKENVASPFFDFLTENVADFDDGVFQIPLPLRVK